MAKIDCSVTVNFLKEHNRMCEYNISHDNCYECPMNSSIIGMGYSCRSVSIKAPYRAIGIVQKWSDEHPVKTRLEDLLDKYPNFKVFSETGRQMYKPRAFGYCGDCFACPNNKAEHCWNEPVDGGATGKAVE